MEQTQASGWLAEGPLGLEAGGILRSCVYCGFCNGTCPTFLVSGNEMDAPRGRVALIKGILEAPDIAATDDEFRQKFTTAQGHLDTCLTCRACETMCPSGVQFARLMDITRERMEPHTQRDWKTNLLRNALLSVIPYRQRFAPLLRLGQLFRPLLPAKLKQQVPPRQQAKPVPQRSHQRRMLALTGCVQAAATPNTDAAALRVLDRLGVEVRYPGGGCCGAAHSHLGEHEKGLAMMRDNIDAWWPEIEAGAEAIVLTASGCGSMVKDYGKYLAHDAAYAAKAEQVSALAKDIGEIIAAEDLSGLGIDGQGQLVAFHSPCSLQHGQRVRGVIEEQLKALNFKLAGVGETHLCCGAAGTYSVLQPELSEQFRERKLNNLQADEPELIVTANVGCQLHLQAATSTPVKHWIELLDAA